MDERTRELDQRLVKVALGSRPHGQPQFFQDLVRLEIKLPVEAVEIGKVARIQVLSLKGLNHGGDAGAFTAHPGRVKGWQANDKQLASRAKPEEPEGFSLTTNEHE